MSISVLTGTMQAVTKWTAQKNLTGDDYAPTVNAGQIQKSQSYSTSVANAALGGADEFISYLLTIAASGNSTVDLTALTNILQQASVTVARVKGYMFRLLSTTDDSTNGTLCTSITIGNAASNAQVFNLSSATPTIDVFKGGCLMYFDQTAGGFTVDGTHKNVKILNNDATYAAKVQITLMCGST